MQDTEVEGGDHAPDHAIAVGRGVSVGEHLRLEGVAYGMPEVERTAEPLLAGVYLHDTILQRPRAFD